MRGKELLVGCVDFIERTTRVVAMLLGCEKWGLETPM